MRIGNNKTLSPRSHSEVFFHDESCTPSDCTPMRTAIRKRPHPPRRGRVLSELPFQPASVARGACTDLGLMTSLRCSAG